MYYTSHIFNIYPFSAAVLFSCLGAMVMEMYNNIAHPFDFKNSRQFTASIWKAKLIQLRKHCLLVGELVNQINRCFGAFLLIFITSQFCRMITQSFHLMTSVWKHDWATGGGVLIQLLINFIHFFIVVYIPFRIRQKVLYIS